MKLLTDKLRRFLLQNGELAAQEELNPTKAVSATSIMVMGLLGEVGSTV